jgi:hypothetical protein
MIYRQAGTMLHPGAQRSEHRKTWTRAPGIPMHAYMAGFRQSGLQLGAWSRHHPGASFPLAPPHYIDTITRRQKFIKPVSTFRGEDHLPMTCTNKKSDVQFQLS